MTRMPLTYAEKKKSSIPRKSYARFPNLLDVPNLIEVQLTSFQWLQEIGLKQLLDDISNKRDEDGVSHALKDLTGNRLELSFAGHEFREPRHSEQVCRQRGLTFSAPLYVRGRLLIKATGEIKEQDIFFGEIPQMTAKGTFVISGAERVVVSQLLRSPGVYFFSEEDPNSGRGLCRTKLIPDRGAWLEFETSNRDVIVAKIDGKRKIPVTTFLRAIGYSNDEELLGLFANEEDSQSHHFIRTTMGLEPLVKTKSDALIDIYRKVRPNDPPNIESAKKLIKNLFFNPLHYSLGKVGRYKLNKRLGLNVPEEHGALTKEDIVEIVRRVIMINNGTDDADDIDHLGNRRVRTVGELVQKQFRIGLLRLERVAMERMSVINTEAVTPSALINVRPIVASITEFFNSSQLSQFMDQTNPLAELTHKRRLSAMGPGGLTRERAGFEVRDVHFSHYGRICPIETPEGPNIGLIGSLATYSLINKYGFIETPYRKIYRELENSDAFLLGKTASETIKDDDGKVISKAGTTISPKHIDKLNRLSPRMIKVAAFVSNELEYLSADREDVYSIAQANAKVDKHNQLIEEKIEARHGDHYLLETNDKVNFMDVSPKQLFSIATALIPFLEHNDANRALMGANMQRQAMPLVKPEAPLIATGMELEAAEDSGQVVFAQHAGMVTSSTASKIVVTRDDGEEDVYPLSKYVRTNQGTCINQHPVIRKGDRVEAGRVLADSSATEQGELALGQNILCAFMSWEGYNYEDAIIISNRLVREDNFTSIHIERHETEARDTKLGPEEITRDIPNVGEESLRELDETGVVRIGAEVKPGDILVGKITPKGETELSAEEKLLRAIFGEKAREVKDTSLRVPHGEWGKAIDVRVFSRDAGDDLPAGVNERVQVWIAQRRQISVGDKLAGRHGNKGVVSIIAPVEDMPFLEDGTPIDMILNPIGVPSRMNIGQVLEAHLGWAAQTLGFRVLTPVFDGATDDDIEDELARAWVAKKAAAINTDDGRSTLQLEKAKAWVESQGYRGDKVFNDEYPGEARSVCLRLWLEELGVSSRDFDLQQLEQAVDKASSERNLAPPTSGKVNLCDGRTGEALDQPVTVGNLYMVKLIHLVEDKVHARSTGPYSLISQQPLGGKAQFGGQRFGEMEVWTLEAYSAAHNLQEMLTIKSDDITGRSKTYEAIIKNEEVVQAGVPESFKVLVKELQSLSIAVEIINEEKEITSAEKLDEVSPPESEFEITEGEAIAEDEKERGPGPANEIPEPEAQAKTAEAIAEDEKEREPGPANEIPEPEAQAKTAEATAEEEKEKEPGPANEIPEPEAQAKTAEAKTAEAKTAEAKTAEAKTAEAIAEGEKEENA